MNHPINQPLHGKIYSDSSEALEIGALFAEESFGMKVIMCQDLAQLADVEKRQLKAFAGWGLPLMISFVFWLFITTYCILRYIVWGSQNPWYTLFMYVGNKIMSWLALWLYSASYLPGAVIFFFRLVSGRKVLFLPAWVQQYMSIRKHLGILGTLALLVRVYIAVDEEIVQDRLWF